jgi:hypothetical protein
MTAPYPIHRMIQDLLRDHSAAELFAKDPAETFARYGVTQEQADLLEQGTMEAMTRLGVHPNLQMKYLRLRKGRSDGAKLVDSSPLAAYLDRLLEKHDG